MMTYYEILGVAKDATAKQIKAAYRKMAQTHHPDKGGDSLRFVEIQQAYDTLSDAEKREHYDRYGTIKPNDSLMDKAKQHVGAIFTSVMSQPFDQYTNVVEVMTVNTKNEISRAKQHSLQLQAERKKNLMVHKRLKRTGQEDLLLQILRGRRHEIWRNYSNLKEVIKTLNVALGMISGYSYTSDSRPARQYAPWATSTSTMG
jgi:curved DNA-binding protein CbpA